MTQLIKTNATSILYAEWVILSAEVVYIHATYNLNPFLLSVKEALVG